MGGGTSTNTLQRTSPFNPAGQLPSRSGHLRCPHCEVPGSVRSSEEVTPQHRNLFYTCQNPLCGHTWKATLSYDYGLSPSAIPNPAVTLPMRTPSREEAMALVHPPPPPDPNQPSLFE